MQMVEAPVVADLSLGVVVAKGTAQRDARKGTGGKEERETHRQGIGSVRGGEAAMEIVCRISVDSIRILKNAERS